MSKFELSFTSDNEYGFTGSEIEDILRQVVAACNLGKDVLILPPDYTRMHSGGGIMTQGLYKLIKENDGSKRIDVMPALGTHVPVSDEEKSKFFTGIPDSSFLIHNWKTEVKKIGEVPQDFISQVSDGLINEKFEVEVNKALLDDRYSCIISVGQVVPHEVAGMANYTKNILVGVGGSRFINNSHLLGAMYGMDRIMGRENTPVRAVFDYAQEHFLDNLPIVYLLTVTTNTEKGVAIHGIFVGNQRVVYEKACELAKQKNLIFVDKPFKKTVVYLDPDEFKSTWLGNKAIYRTRLAMEQGGELIVLAPGVERFGEDGENDRLIRKYGYVGRENVIKLFAEHDDLKNNQSVVAHLIHGSADGKFKVTYATKLLTREEVENANFSYMPYDEAALIYNPEKLKDGLSMLDNGEEIFYISNPALGLWSIPF